LLALPILAALALSVVACRDDSAERAGRKIDEAVQDTREAGKEALNDAGDAVNDAGAAVDEAAEDAREKARKALE
jgi:hypothetical protein